MKGTEAVMKLHFTYIITMRTVARDDIQKMNRSDLSECRIFIDVK